MSSLKREIITTKDGSKTIHIPEWNEQYHSKHGAAQEARHVFLQMGLHHYLNVNNDASAVRILEIGFGTGLNALLTFYEAQALNVAIAYTGVEAYPVSIEEAQAMSYHTLITAADSADIYNKLHDIPWGESVQIASRFDLHKREQLFEHIADQNAFDLIYFDAFGARVQPDLWTEPIFNKMITALVPGGVLVTYAAKGSVRRAMQAVGFTVERLPGPPGKREMLRATKQG